jgi:uncharacterized protein
MVVSFFCILIISGVVFHKKTISVVIVVIVVLGAGVGFTIMKKTSAEVKINTVSIAVEVVDSVFERRRGLSGRSSLSPSEGMLFVFEEPGYHSIWMKEMLFPIDIIWIADGYVVDIKENAPPPASGTLDVELPVYTPDVPADFVLEVNAGFVQQHNIRIGDEVEITVDNVVRIKGVENYSSRFDDEEMAPLLSQREDSSMLGQDFFIERLRYLPPHGADFQVGELLAETDAYNTYLISYQASTTRLSGMMTVPNSSPPDNGFPVIVLNHGLIYPSIYYSGRGSRRERDFFGRNGYVTIHPDYRGYGGDSEHACAPTLSWIATGCAHDFYVGYTLDIIAAIDALRQVQLPYVDANRIGMWGHSMGGNMAARIMVMRPDIRAYVLFAPVSADVEDNFYELPEYELARIAEAYGVGSEARKLFDQMSPLQYFSDVEAPVQLHHGTADTDVPIAFSEKMYAVLKKLGKLVEFFAYPDEPHEFIQDWQLAADRSLQFFDLYVKGAR